MKTALTDPQDMLNYIKCNIRCEHPYQKYPILSMDDTEWLIKRVGQLEKALVKLKLIGGISEVNKIIKEALEEMP